MEGKAMPPFLTEKEEKAMGGTSSKKKSEAVLLISSMEREQAKQSASPRPSTEFAWNTCAGEDLPTRVSLKQDAVDDAFEHARRIRDQLSDGIRNMNSDEEAASDAMGVYDMRAWMEELGEDAPSCRVLCLIISLMLQH